MGKIVSNFFISLDGVVESPDQWHFPYFNDEMGAAIGEGMATSGAFLMGRVLYREWSEYWPAQARSEPAGSGGKKQPEDVQADANEFADFINDIPKYVVSSTLDEATWRNTTVISGDVAGQLRDVKERTEGDVTMSGSATLVRWLLANGLLDELHLLVHPIAVGSGARLFEQTPTHRLQLLRHRALSTGVLHLVYAPAAD